MSNQRRGELARKKVIYELKVERWVLSVDMNDAKDGTSLKSFGREFQIRDPADRKPQEASVVPRRSSTRRWVEEDRSDRLEV